MRNGLDKFANKWLFSDDYPLTQYFFNAIADINLCLYNTLSITLTGLFYVLNFYPQAPIS